MDNKTENKNVLAFIKEIAKYFMDFLETDFHKRKNPKRSVKSRNSDNLLVGLNLSKYPSFSSLVNKAINHVEEFDKNTLKTIKKGVYKTNIPKNLLDLVELQTKKITNKQITQILEQIAEAMKKSAALYKKEYDQALNTSLEDVDKILRTDLVSLFIGNIEKPLKNLNLGDKDNIYLMEEGLTAVLSSSLKNKISGIVKLLLAKEKVDISKQLKNVFELADIKSKIHSFFENFRIDDLFAEIYEMEKNRTILDKQDFYLYFCDITFNNTKFPIFYIQFKLEPKNEVLTIEFDSKVYINKKALDYITQEYNQEKGKKGNLKTISERTIYLAQHQNDFRDMVIEILSEITNFFELDKSIDINNSEMQRAKSFLVKVSNNCYLALFDKSDESLINDYEEILKLLMIGNSVLGEAFNKLIDNFIHKNPQSFNPTVEGEWDDTETSDRLVFKSPISLNGEQRQILSAIRKDDCKYIIVEGPPGTGKSHTITAIVFDSILNNQSVLVLSDKKEALDVVEDKITETMNKIRFDKDSQNPILRLGKIGNTYSQIVSTAAVNNIKMHYRIVEKKYETLISDIEKSCDTLKKDLQAEILAYKEIDIKQVHELFCLESYCVNKGFPVEIDEILSQPESTIDLEEFKKRFLSLKDKLVIDHDEKEKEAKLNDFFELLNFSEWNQKHLRLLDFLSSSVAKIKEIYANDLALLSMFDNFNEPSLEKLSNFITNYENEKNWFFGYKFKKEKIKNLDKEFKKFFKLTMQIEPHKNLEDLKKVLRIYQFAQEELRMAKLNKKYQIEFDYLNLLHQAINDDTLAGVVNNLTQIADDLIFLNINLPKYPNTIKKLKIDLHSFKTFYSNELVKISDADFYRLIRFINLKRKVEKDFNNIPALNYARRKKEIEELVSSQMTFLLDKRFIDFYENNKASVKRLRDINRAKRRFPKDEFLQLKKAFSCILAGIRDYAEYIPLEAEIFDLVIIDEASQVSIAQAFPALLRARKILVLGDKKQFSNVKTAHARTDTNMEYLNKLRDCFVKNVSGEEAKLVNFEKFNIKTSILEFFEFIANYNVQLLKHFRGYKEIISYSNERFYGGMLQVMKIRGKAIGDVIKFSYVNHDGKKELRQNTNTTEAEFIVSELKRLKEIDNNQSIGIITPHTGQQKLLVDLISRMPEKDYFYDKLKLKIMTFDTCQGEERDIIFYSMVATEEDDRLLSVFIKDLKDVDIEEDGNIRAQRLNVGLSRAKETMNFVLSKPIEKYNDSIGEALRHYNSILEEAEKERSVSEVDKKSKMEPEVMNWFYQTDFYKKNKDKIEFKPQFELGKYLKQLDKTYNHPKYKIDFLLVY